MHPAAVHGRPALRDKRSWPHLDAQPHAGMTNSTATETMSDHDAHHRARAAAEQRGRCGAPLRYHNLRCHHGRQSRSRPSTAEVFGSRTAACSATAAKSKGMDMLRWTAPTEVLRRHLLSCEMAVRSSFATRFEALLPAERLRDDGMDGEECRTARCRDLALS